MENMRVFEVGKCYGDYGIKHMITKRTAKTVTFISIQHLGRYNERRTETRKAKIHNWTDREVFIVSDETVEA